MNKICTFLPLHTVDKLLHISSSNLFCKKAILLFQNTNNSKPDHKHCICNQKDILLIVSLIISQKKVIIL